MKVHRSSPAADAAYRGYTYVSGTVIGTVAAWASRRASRLRQGKQNPEVAPAQSTLAQLATFLRARAPRRVGIPPEGPLSASVRRDGQRAARRPASRTRRVPEVGTANRNVLHVGTHVLGWQVPGRSPWGTPVTSGNARCNRKGGPRGAREFAPSVGCSSFMPRSVQSAMTTARFVVVACI